MVLYPKCSISVCKTIVVKNNFKKREFFKYHKLSYQSVRKKLGLVVNFFGKFVVRYKNYVYCTAYIYVFGTKLTVRPGGITNP